MKPSKEADIQILLVDQDKHVRESLRIYFGSDHRQFLIFKSGSEGLNSLKHQRFDIAIADYFLPDMDGISFLKTVGEKSPGTLRILMATIASDELKKEAQHAGVDRFLEKPLTIATLDSVLNELSTRRAPDPKKT